MFFDHVIQTHPELKQMSVEEVQREITDQVTKKSTSLVIHNVFVHENTHPTEKDMRYAHASTLNMIDHAPYTHVFADPGRHLGRS